MQGLVRNSRPVRNPLETGTKGTPGQRGCPLQAASRRPSPPKGCSLLGRSPTQEHRARCRARQLHMTAPSTPWAPCILTAQRGSIAMVAAPATRREQRVGLASPRQPQRLPRGLPRPQAWRLRREPVALCWHTPVRLRLKRTPRTRRSVWLGRGRVPTASAGACRTRRHPNRPGSRRRQSGQHGVAPGDFGPEGRGQARIVCGPLGPRSKPCVRFHHDCLRVQRGFANPTGQCRARNRAQEQGNTTTCEPYRPAAHNSAHRVGACLRAWTRHTACSRTATPAHSAAAHSTSSRRPAQPYPALYLSNSLLSSATNCACTASTAASAAAPSGPTGGGQIGGPTA